MPNLRSHASLLVWWRYLLAGCRCRVFSFLVSLQANALFKKNITYQWRQCCLNMCLLACAIVVPIVLLIIQKIITGLLNVPELKCGCQCTRICPTTGGGACLNLVDYTDPTTGDWLAAQGATIVDKSGSQSLLIYSVSKSASVGTTYKCSSYNGNCGLQYSFPSQATFCPVTSPPTYPPLLQVPLSQYRIGYEGCNDTISACPLTTLYTSASPATAASIMANVIPDAATTTNFILANPNLSTLLAAYAAAGGNAAAASNAAFQVAALTLKYDPTTLNRQFGLLVGTAAADAGTYLSEPAFSNHRLFYVMQSCSAFAATYQTLAVLMAPGGNISCTTNINAIKVAAADMNTAIYNGYYESSAANGIPHEVSNSYDFRASNPAGFTLDLDVYFNLTKTYDAGFGSSPLSRVSAAVNAAAQGWLKTALQSKSYGAPLYWLKDMPTAGTTLNIDISSLIGKIFYVWLFQLLFPVWTSMLVYEKELNLRTMMKMQGLGDASYWTINYLYYLAMWILYMLLLIAFGAACQLPIFQKTNFGIQFCFFFLFGNMQISLAFLSSSLYSKALDSVIINVLYVLVSGLMGEFLFERYLTSGVIAGGGIFTMELIPPFGLYRGLYEMSEYALEGAAVNRNNVNAGMQPSDLPDPLNGMRAMWGIFVIEWIVFMVFALYLDKVLPTSSGIQRPWLFFLDWFKSKKTVSDAKAAEDFLKPTVALDMEHADVAAEREMVNGLPSDGGGYAIVARGLSKAFPPRGGRPAFKACKSLALAIARGECFGMLGPNGAGKSTSINMLVGFLKPSEGTALVEGYNIRTQMDEIYTIMGVCPQHDLLWETLTSREHLRFYGRLKNLKGAELEKEIDSLLRKVNLFHGGVGDKRCGEYSGGMKRRLSVAISLIGSPLVVYLDEPSTGLDPASRRNLWNVVKEAKKDRAIILTTHSMEEAEVLCDRLGIFVDGALQCLGSPKELTARYGGFLIFTLVTPIAEEDKAREFVSRTFPAARCSYALAGTAKYELPTTQVSIADVFGAMEKVKAHLTILDWGIANMTLEEVFIKISTGIQAEKGEISLA